MTITKDTEIAVWRDGALFATFLGTIGLYAVGNDDTVYVGMKRKELDELIKSSNQEIVRKENALKTKIEILDSERFKLEIELKKISQAKV